MAGKRKSFLLRLPPELHDELRAWAEQDMRSLNGHLEWLLREALRKRRGDKRAPEPPKDDGDDDSNAGS